MSFRGLLAVAVAILAGYALTACGGGSGGNQTTTPPPAQQTQAISGTITGLTGSGLVLQDNGGDNLTVPPGTTNFTFATPIATGGTYSVTIMASPANTTCSVAQGSGTVAMANVTNIAVTCAANSGGTSATYNIGGTITGLTGSGLVLQDNGGDNLTVPPGTTNFTFATPIATGGTYSVTVIASPANTTCSVARGSGTVATANVTNIAVTCAAGSGGTSATYTIGGTITGLTGSGLVLENNGGSPLTVAASAQSFTFTPALATGNTYAITVLYQPANETCTVMNGTGTVGSANVTNVAISCSGKFVYVVNTTDNTSGNVSQFTIDPATGALTAIGNGKVTAGTKPIGIAIDYAVPNLPQLYVANATSTDVTQLAFSTTSNSSFTAGALVEPFNTTIPTEPASISAAPSGAFLFTGGSGTAPHGALYGFTLNQFGDPSTAYSTTVTAGPVSGLAVDPSSTLVFATIATANQVEVYSITSGAALTAVPNNPFATGNGPRGVVAWPKSTSTAGFVYTANQADNTISAFSYNSSQGSLQLQPATTVSTGQAPAGITIDPTGAYLYTANSADGTVSAFSINQSTGALTALGAAVASGNLNPTLHANPGPVDLEVDPSGKYLYCVNGTDGSVSLFTVSAGALTLSHTYATGAGATAVAIY